MRLFIGLVTLVPLICILADAPLTTAEDVDVDFASVEEPISLTDVADAGAAHANAADSRQPRDGFGGLGLYGGFGLYGGIGYGTPLPTTPKPWSYGGFAYWPRLGYGYDYWG